MAIRLVTTQAHVMLCGMGQEACGLWHAAVQHACWTLRRGTTLPRRLVPAFGDKVAVKLKHVPADSFAPRGKAAIFIGAAEDVARGIIVTTREGDAWNIEVATSYVQHGAVEKDAANQEAPREPKDDDYWHLDDDANKDKGNPEKFPAQEELEYADTQEEPVDGRRDDRAGARRRAAPRRPRRGRLQVRAGRAR